MIERYMLVAPITVPGLIEQIRSGTVIEMERTDRPLMQYEPPEVRDWLAARGWAQAGPTTWNVARSAYANEELKTFDMTWEQAVAYEAFRFLNIGVTP